MDNLINDIRIILIKDNGDIQVIFSSNDESNKNTCTINNVDDIKMINEYHDKIKNVVYNKNDNNDKHLFYLKQHINDNLSNEFKKMGINPNNIKDDLLLYYYMSTMNYVVLVNSSEHINIMVTPSNGISNNQENRLDDLKNIFPNNILWCLSHEMHIEVFEENGHKYGTLELGDVIEGKYEDVISKYKEKIKRH
ncbi:MAG: hypothetical protein E7157_06035 [Lactobacillales bacterium]|nr:hypothetical protein [Lactobacillales bacterium]